MAEFVKGDVVVIPFPFSDLSQTKRRPALIISSTSSNDLILCQITSKTVKDYHSISIDDNSFESGTLNQPSNVRPNRLFTADKNIILYKIGKLNKPTINSVIERIIEIIKN